MQSIDLTNHFLIAMPAMADPFFSKTLTYICEHSEQGALGLVVNRPIDLTLKELFDQLGISADNQSLERSPVMFGGPIQLDRGFVFTSPSVNGNPPWLWTQRKNWDSRPRSIFCKP